MPVGQTGDLAIRWVWAAPECFGSKIIIIHDHTRSVVDGPTPTGRADADMWPLPGTVVSHSQEFPGSNPTTATRIYYQNDI